MSNDGKLSNNPQTCIQVSISITPGQGVHGDLAGVLGNFAFDLSELVAISRKTSSNLNVRLLEALTDVLEQGGPREGELKVEFSVVGDETVIGVSVPQHFSSDPSSNEWFPPDASSSPKEQLAKTVRERRRERATGGLELMRLRSRTKKKPSGSSGGMSGAPALLEFVPLRKKTQ